MARVYKIPNIEQLSVFQLLKLHKICYFFLTSSFPLLEAVVQHAGAHAAEARKDHEGEYHPDPDVCHEAVVVGGQVDAFVVDLPVQHVGARSHHQKTVRAARAENDPGGRPGPRVVHQVLSRRHPHSRHSHFVTFGRPHCALTTHTMRPLDRADAVRLTDAN